MELEKFLQVMEIPYHDIEIFKQAFTHTSYANENKLKNHDYERLEFLGDAFFDAIISVELFNRMGQVTEGKLTKTRALIVCEKSLATVAQKLRIGEYLNMGKGEEHSGGRHRESILADAVEAVIGAIYLDGGYDEAARFVSREFEATVIDALAGKLFTDYKTQVQEALQKRGQKTSISYHLDKEEGPDHDKTFYVHLVCNGKTLGSGRGKSKKEAEQNAARATLEGGIR